jgi:hypothetical protein
MAGRLVTRRELLLSMCLLAALDCRRSPTSDARQDTATRTVAGAPAAVALRAPADSAIPDGPLGVSIRRGRVLLIATRDSLPQYVGNRLRCVSCHLDNGLRANSSPWIGVYAHFPQFRSRSGTVQVLEDRINDCFQRSMNGRALSLASRKMHDMMAYFAFLRRLRCGEAARTTSAPEWRGCGPPPPSSDTTCPSTNPARSPTSRHSMSPPTSTADRAPIFAARRTIGRTATRP